MKKRFLGGASAVALAAALVVSGPLVVKAQDGSDPVENGTLLLAQDGEQPAEQPVVDTQAQQQAEEEARKAAEEEELKKRQQAEEAARQAEQQAQEAARQAEEQAQEAARQAEEAARQAAKARGIVINGLPIMADSPDLDRYYQTYVIIGLDSFIEPARDFDDYVRAIREKLLKELRPVAS